MIRKHIRRLAETMVGPEKTNAIFSAVRQRLETFRYSYLKIDRMPSQRPSVNSIYFLVNQLGKHQPVGLTHAAAVGYHELPFAELKFKVSRHDLQDRVARIRSAISLKGKWGVDIGSALGGLTFALQKEGAQMMGIERDRPSINVSLECEALFKTGAKFTHGSVSETLLLEVVKSHHNPSSGHLDFAIWFSSFNWVAQALGDTATQQFLRTFSKHCDVLLLDSAIGGKGQEFMGTLGIHGNDDFCAYIQRHTAYTKVESIGKDAHWYDREVFKFSK